MRIFFHAYSFTQPVKQWLLRESFSIVAGICCATSGGCWDPTGMREHGEAGIGTNAHMTSRVPVLAAGGAAYAGHYAKTL